MVKKNSNLFQDAVARFVQFNKVFDSRFEDFSGTNKWSILYRDMSAGLVVALTAIPLAMGFAMAMGLRPEQGLSLIHI